MEQRPPEHLGKQRRTPEHPEAAREGPQLPAAALLQPRRDAPSDRLKGADDRVGEARHQVENGEHGAGEDRAARNDARRRLAGDDCVSAESRVEHRGEHEQQNDGGVEPAIDGDRRESRGEWHAARLARERVRTRELAGPRRHEVADHHPDRRRAPQWAERQVGRDRMQDWPPASRAEREDTGGGDGRQREQEPVGAADVLHD
jgi:hypothetical protein